MIATLNRWIEENILNLSPFNAEGLSTTATLAGVLFARLEEDENGRARLRLFANAAPVTDELERDPELLLNILTLTGPASPYGTIRLGADNGPHYLWAADEIPVDPAEPALTAEALERFITESDLLRENVLEAVRQAGEAQARQTPAAEEPLPEDGSPVEARGAAAQQPAPRSADDLSSLMADPSVLWG